MKKIAIVNFRRKIKSFETLNLTGFDEVISLSPFSNFILSELCVSYVSYSEHECMAFFNKDIKDIYERVERDILFKGLGDQKYYFRDLAKYLTYEKYLAGLMTLASGNRLIYVSDEVYENIFPYCDLNNFVEFEGFQLYLNENKWFYFRNKIEANLAKINFQNIKNFFLKSQRTKYLYDNRFYEKEYKLYSVPVDTYLEKSMLKNENIYLLVDKYIKNKYLQKIAIKEFSSYELSQNKEDKYIPFMFLHGVAMYSRITAYKRANVKSIFMQHGSYIHENYFLKYSEAGGIADINLVFNDFTKTNFDSMLPMNSATKTIIVGTLLHRTRLRKTCKEYKYDYIYITDCSQYFYGGRYVGCIDNTPDCDALNIYRQHKDVINLFGEKFPKLKICIKIQPGIHLGKALYVPLLELAKQYPNVHIKFSKKLVKLIAESRRVLSDYFSTEFSNPYVLEGKDIIMFDNIMPIADDIKQDINNLVILISSIEMLNEVLNNFEYYKSKLKKTSELIEKYSCKKDIDTYSLVKDVIKHELLNE